MPRFHNFARAACCCLLVFLLAVGAAVAQQPTSPPQQQAGPSQGPKPSQAEKRITPEEAKELFESVDAILRFASQDTRLPIRGEVKRQLMNRAQLHDFILKKMDEDPDTQRFQRSEAVLKKFGLLPADFHLQNFMVGLLDEQVAGFYEPKTKTVYLLDWVEAEGQQPVLAHELTHALQDQNFDLEKWSDVVPDPSGKQAERGADPYNLEPDEERAARQAVSEGQAMAVLVDYLLAPSGHTIADNPLMAEMFKRQTVQQTADSPILNSAPLYVREALTFSYTFGLSFIQKLLAEGGKQLAFDAALRVPPRNTREVMNPDAYLEREGLPPMPFPRIVEMVEKKYPSYDAGVVGQFDVCILLKQFGGDAKLAEELSDKWRGGLYWVVQRPGHQEKAGSPVQAGDLALFYLSRWASPEDAGRFAEQYRAWLPKRYKRAVNAGSKNVPATKWNTEDGTAWIEPWKDQVLVMEGFDDATAAAIRTIVQKSLQPSVPPTPVPAPHWAPSQQPLAQGRH